ncbi:family 20 glycosylhydrolase [Pseudoduganella sp. OTU4001]|uniref:family 20 glycosylhydrolase n=1 Tax=Pseudoduganella sp. OTU4001 TaxID=3043854 RepID=UPI00313CA1FA
MVFKKVVAGAAMWTLASAALAAFDVNQLQLRWELVRNEAQPQGRDRSLARLTLVNRGQEQLPAAGWALYFTSMEVPQAAPLANGLVLEQASAHLYRLRPAASFAGLAPGASVAADYHYTVALNKLGLAPGSPYMVLDGEPSAGKALADYRPSWTATAAASPQTSAESLFSRNAATIDLAPDQLSPVFPTPQHLTRSAGVLRMAAMPDIAAAPGLKREAGQARALLAPYLGAPDRRQRLTLAIGKVAGMASPEAYSLVVDPKRGIALTGNSAAGVYRGLQSLRDLLPAVPAAGRTLELPALRIVDAPRFAYRGVMLDVARNFQSKENVKRLLDLMARYKLNKFHFHLTDDEGWRLDIAGLPELTGYGARRGHTLTMAEHLPPVYGSGPALDDPYGSGFYSRADYIEILRYAQARHIEVIPEIEMPGHARAAVYAMEQRFRRLSGSDPAAAARYRLRDPGDQSQYFSAQSFSDNVMDPGLASTYAFVGHVVREVAAMHREAGAPLATLHVGGDELPAGAWEKSPASIAMMRALGVNSTGALWDHFYQRVAGMLRQQGLRVAGWEELGAHSVLQDGKRRQVPNPAFSRSGFQVYAWNNVGDAADLAYRLANAGYQTVLAPATTLYFDMAYNADADEPGMTWAAMPELEQVFDFNPLAAPAGGERLSQAGRQRILGLEGVLFTELVRGTRRLDYMLVPRMLALAERAWAAEPAWVNEREAAWAVELRKAGWSHFANQLGKRVLPRLDAEGLAVDYRIAPPGLRVEQGRVIANHQLPGFALHYTTDGSAPHAGSARVNGPISARGTVRVAAVAANGRAGASSQVVLP